MGLPPDPVTLRGGVPLGQPKGEPVTVEHPIFEEIGAAIGELLNRTVLLAQGQALLTQVLVDNGLIEVEEEPSEGTPAADA